ncbi:MAG: glycosyltransferase family 2 protein [Candidatus Omnitrophota bacterium]
MNDIRHPLVSIVTPTFNRSRFIDRLVKNVLAQTYQDFELVLVDDGSTDNTRELVDRWIKENPGRIQYVYQPNQGSGAARNNGIKQAKGKYIAFLDSDDEWTPDYLDKIMTVLEKGEFQWTVTGARRIDIGKDGRELDTKLIRCHLQEFSHFFKRELNVYEALLTGNVVGETSRIAVLKQALLAVGGFRDHLKLSQDYELWLRLAKAGYKLFITDEPLVLYRKSVDSVTKTRLVEGLRYGFEIICEYSRDAVKLDPMYRKFYGEKLWGYARDILHQPKRDYILILKCMIKSLMFDFNLTRIFSSLNTNMNVSK